MRLAFILCLALLISCGEDQPSELQGDSTAPGQGNLVINAGAITSLGCSKNPANLYSVYLPLNADSAAAFPVLVFFTPDAKGKVALEKYKVLADKWNFILVGSDYTKNGMEAATAIAAAGEVIDDVKGRFNIDPARIYLSGFSGGARVAAGTALSRMDITGVIGCSASPPKSLQPLAFVGIAGLGDMNYLELKKFIIAEEGKAGLHELMVFDGKHEWPPVEVMQNAMLMVSLYQPGTPLSGNMNEMSDSLSLYTLRSCDTLSKISCAIEIDALKAALRAEKNLSGTGVLEERLKKADANSCVRRDAAVWAKMEVQETDLQKLLADAVLTRDTVWWRNNADGYFETDENGPEKFMRQRLRGYVSLLCYTYCNQAFGMNNLHAVEKLIKVYSIVDPQNAEWAYMQAVLYVRLNMQEFALSSLKKAVELGFSDRARAERDPVFAGLAGSDEFNIILSQMN